MARIADTESDVLLLGDFLDKKRPVTIAAVLTAVAAGHYLSTYQRRRSAAHPRQVWVPRDRGQL